MVIHKSRAFDYAKVWRIFWARAKRLWEMKRRETKNHMTKKHLPATKQDTHHLGRRVGAALGGSFATVNVTKLSSRNLRYHFRAITTASREELPIGLIH